MRPPRAWRGHAGRAPAERATGTRPTRARRRRARRRRAPRHRRPRGRRPPPRRTGAVGRGRRGPSRRAGRRRPRADARHREHRVLVRVRVVERGEGRCRRLLEADVEQEPAVARVEELLERLRALAAGAGRPRGRAEREERALEVAARRVRAVAGAEVAADRRLPADLEVGDVQRALRERRNVVGELGQPLDRHACTDRRRTSRRRRSCRARLPPSMSARRGSSRPYVISGTTIVPPAITVTPAPSPNWATASSTEEGNSTSVACVME